MQGLAGTQKNDVYLFNTRQQIQETPPALTLYDQVSSFVAGTFLQEIRA